MVSGGSHYLLATVIPSYFPRKLIYLKKYQVRQSYSLVLNQFLLLSEYYLLMMKEGVKQLCGIHYAGSNDSSAQEFQALVN